MEPPPEMTRLPPSPSSSLLSLGSDAGQEISEDPKRIIGVRELVKMVKQGRAKPVGTQRREIILNGMPADDGTPPGVSGPPPGYNEENFAKDVAIRGWKIVGGSKGGEKAKVGAYVGMSRSDLREHRVRAGCNTDVQSTTSSLSFKL